MISPALRVDREQMAIDRGPEQRVAGNRHPLVHFVRVVVRLRDRADARASSTARPVTASSATASSAVPVYMMPSTTSGVFSILFWVFVFFA